MLILIRFILKSLDKEYIHFLRNFIYRNTINNDFKVIKRIFKSFYLVIRWNEFQPEFRKLRQPKISYINQTKANLET